MAARGSAVSLHHPPVPAAALRLDPASVALAVLSEEALDRMAAAGAEACEWERILARTGDNVVGELLRSHGLFREWDHCPNGDVYDPASHAQYFYHAHPRAERAPGEHGHFHAFLRGDPFEPGAGTCRASGPLYHLVGLSMDRDGKLVRLFTTNRWVTGEAWRPADAVVAGLDWFDVALARPSWPTNRWITAVVQLFRPQIEALVRARDRIVAARQAADPQRDVLEDRALGTVSEMWVTVPEQIMAVQRARGRQG